MQVRGRWTPALETWRPRVNGVQLKVGAMHGLACSAERLRRSSQARCISIRLLSAWPPCRCWRARGCLRARRSGRRCAPRSPACASTCAGALRWGGHRRAAGQGRLEVQPGQQPEVLHGVLGAVKTPSNQLARCSESSVERLHSELRDFAGMVGAATLLPAACFAPVHAHCARRVPLPGRKERPSRIGAWRFRSAAPGLPACACLPACRW